MDGGPELAVFIRHSCFQKRSASGGHPVASALSRASVQRHSDRESKLKMSGRLDGHRRLIVSRFCRMAAGEAITMLRGRRTHAPVSWRVSGVPLYRDLSRYAGFLGQFLMDGLTSPRKPRTGETAKTLLHIAPLFCGTRLLGRSPS